MARNEPIDEATCFREGIQLFNDGEWFEAHESWEDIWHIASGERKRFYQGLIQCAVTLEHARRGNPRGVRSVWGTCVPKFKDIDRVYMGIDTGALLGGVEQTIAPILDLPDRCFDPAKLRGHMLPTDWEKVPQIKLAYDPFK